MSATYAKEIRKSLGNCATWLPNTTLLWDVGVLKDHSYRRVAAANDFGLQFTSREGPRAVRPLRRHARGIDYIHFACHGFSPMAKPLELQSDFGVDQAGGPEFNAG